MDFTEFFKLRDMMVAAGYIGADYENDKAYRYVKNERDEYGRIDIMKDGKSLANAVMNRFSRGHDQGLLEIEGGITEDEAHLHALMDWCLGDLSANEVFERFDYCFKNNTSIFKF